MSGIKCHKCGAIVSSAAAKTRLAADSVKWGVDRTIDGIRAINPNVQITIGAAAGIGPVAVTSTPESGVLAEQYNAQGYKCINDHSGSWVNAD